jgi:hypothetical protein
LIEKARVYEKSRFYTIGSIYDDRRIGNLGDKMVELVPEEVKSRAEIIVMGTYDFKSKPKPSEFNFSGYKFNVSEVEAKAPIPKVPIKEDGNLLKVIMFSLASIVTVLLILRFLGRENAKSY